MDFSSIEDLEANGFLGFKLMKDIFKDRSSIPPIKGVYLVLYISNQNPQFLKVGSGPTLYKKKTDPNVSIDELKSNWVDDTIVINIGKAGGLNKQQFEGKETLKSRLTTYLSFGQGKDVRHYGGRLIWQLFDSNNLVVCWKPTPLSEPRDLEASLIKEFKSIYGKRPFANLQD